MSVLEFVVIALAIVCATLVCLAGIAVWHMNQQQEDK